MFYTPNIAEAVFPILEIGPGALPYQFSDVWLDINFSQEDRIIQAGGAKSATGKPIVYYDGKKFPFKDKAFKYVVASHVLEHVAWEDVPLFISEMERVAEAGYIELPRWTWELINDIPTHKLTGDVSNGKLILYRKTFQHDYNFFTKIMLEESQEFRGYIEKEKKLFFCRIEWNGLIPYELREDAYQISEKKSLIADVLKNDFSNLKKDISIENEKLTNKAVSVVAESSKNFFDFFKIKNEVSKNSISSLSRKELNELDLAEHFLQCPKCQGKIKADLSCVNCGFSFEKDIENKYFPLY